MQNEFIEQFIEYEKDIDEKDFHFSSHSLALDFSDISNTKSKEEKEKIDVVVRALLMMPKYDDKNPSFNKDFYGVETANKPLFSEDDIRLDISLQYLSIFLIISISLLMRVINKNLFVFYSIKKCLIKAVSCNNIYRHAEHCFQI